MVSLTPVSHILLDSQCDTILWRSARGCSDLLRHLGPIKSRRRLLALAGGGLPGECPPPPFPRWAACTFQLSQPPLNTQKLNGPWISGFGLEWMAATPCSLFYNHHIGKCTKRANTSPNIPRALQHLLTGNKNRNGWKTNCAFRKIVRVAVMTLCRQHLSMLPFRQSSSDAGHIAIISSSPKYKRQVIVC